MKHATSRMLFSYWDELRQERVAPERRDVQPAAIRHILADTFIAASDGSGSLAFRLAGTRCGALFGRDLTGVAIDSLWPRRARTDLAEQFDLVLHDTLGLVAGLRGHAGNGWSIDLELLLLPLRHHGRTDIRAVGSLSPVSLPSWIGLIPIATLETATSRIIDPGRCDLPAPPERDSAAERRSRFIVHQGGRAHELCAV